MCIFIIFKCTVFGFLSFLLKISGMFLLLMRLLPLFSCMLGCRVTIKLKFEETEIICLKVYKFCKDKVDEEGVELYFISIGNLEFGFKTPREEGIS